MQKGHLSCPAKQSCHIDPENSQVGAPARARSPLLHEDPGFLVLKSTLPQTPVLLRLEWLMLVERVIPSYRPVLGEMARGLGTWRVPLPMSPKHAAFLVSVVAGIRTGLRQRLWDAGHRQASGH